MEREQAVQLLAALESMHPGFNEATRITLLLEDRDEARKIRRHLAESFGEPLFEIVRYIVRQYPDLDQDKAHGPGEGNTQ
jgi:hypothetical protein